VQLAFERVELLFEGIALWLELRAEVIAGIAAVRSWDDLSQETQCETLATLVERVEINQHGHVTEIIWASIWRYLI
jgi:hypothetical protein